MRMPIQKPLIPCLQEQKRAADDQFDKAVHDTLLPVL